MLTPGSAPTTQQIPSISAQPMQLMVSSVQGGVTHTPGHADSVLPDPTNIQPIMVIPSSHNGDTPVLVDIQPIEGTTQPHVDLNRSDETIDLGGFSVNRSSVINIQGSDIGYNTEEEQEVDYWAHSQLNANMQGVNTMQGIQAGINTAEQHVDTTQNNVGENNDDDGDTEHTDTVVEIIREEDMLAEQQTDSNENGDEDVNENVNEGVNKETNALQENVVPENVETGNAEDGEDAEDITATKTTADTNVTDEQKTVAEKTAVAEEDIDTSEYDEPDEAKEQNRKSRRKSRKRGRPKKLLSSESLPAEEKKRTKSKEKDKRPEIAKEKEKGTRRSDRSSETLPTEEKTRTKSKEKDKRPEINKEREKRPELAKGKETKTRSSDRQAKKDKEGEEVNDKSPRRSGLPLEDKKKTRGREKDRRPELAKDKEKERSRSDRQTRKDKEGEEVNDKSPRRSGLPSEEKKKAKGKEKEKRPELTKEKEKKTRSSDRQTKRDKEGEVNDKSPRRSDLPVEDKKKTKGKEKEKRPELAKDKEKEKSRSNRKAMKDKEEVNDRSPRRSGRIPVPRKKSSSPEPESESEPEPEPEKKRRGARKRSPSPLPLAKRLAARKRNLSNEEGIAKDERKGPVKRKCAPYITYVTETNTDVTDVPEKTPEQEVEDVGDKAKEKDKEEIQNVSEVSKTQTDERPTSRSRNKRKQMPEKIKQIKRIEPKYDQPIKTEDNMKSLEQDANISTPPKDAEMGLPTVALATEPRSPVAMTAGAIITGIIQAPGLSTNKTASEVLPTGSAVVTIPTQPVVTSPEVSMATRKSISTTSPDNTATIPIATTILSQVSMATGQIVTAASSRSPPSYADELRNLLKINTTRQMRTLTTTDVMRQPTDPTLNSNAQSIPTQPGTAQLDQSSVSGANSIPVDQNSDNGSLGAMSPPQSPSIEMGLRGKKYKVAPKEVHANLDKQRLEVVDYSKPDRGLMEEAGGQGVDYNKPDRGLTEDTSIPGVGYHHTRSIVPQPAVVSGISQETTPTVLTLSQIPGTNIQLVTRATTSGTYDASIYENLSDITHSSGNVNDDAVTVASFHSNKSANLMLQQSNITPVTQQSNTNPMLQQSNTIPTPQQSNTTPTNKKQKACKYICRQCQKQFNHDWIIQAHIQDEHHITTNVNEHIIDNTAQWKAERSGRKRNKSPASSTKGSVSSNKRVLLTDSLYSSGVSEAESIDLPQVIAPKVNLRIYCLRMT